MVVEQMIEAAISEIKQNLLLWCREHAEAPLAPQTAEEVTKGIQQALAAVGKAAFKTFLEAKEEPKDIIVVDGETYRFKMFSNKSLTSPWGKGAIHLTQAAPTSCDFHRRAAGTGQRPSQQPAA